MRRLMPNQPVPHSAARPEKGLPPLRATLVACARSSRVLASFAKFHCCIGQLAARLGQRRRPGRWENAALATLLSLHDRTDKARDRLALRRTTEAVGLLLHRLAQLIAVPSHGKTKCRRAEWGQCRIPKLSLLGGRQNIFPTRVHSPRLLVTS
jgi:hypothetical protein